MRDRLDTGQAEFGWMREMINQRLDRGWWERRDAWLKDNHTSMPWDRACGIFSYRDTEGTVHRIVVGGDGNLYHDLDWNTPVVLNDSVVWDDTCTATFAVWRDFLYICLGATDGTARNLRYDGIGGEAFAVGLGAPTVPTVADGGAGLIVAAGEYRYRVTFYDVDTGFESDSSPIAAVTIATLHQVLSLIHI